MYKQGLGDCFLLTFNSKQGLRHMLIDCGVLTGTPGGGEKIRNVAANINSEIGPKLDVLVATHEHWDHISGFWDARTIFDPMKMREIWVAWTEDPNQKILKESKKKKLKLAALQLALAKISDLQEEEQRRGGAIADILGFLGGLSGMGMIGFSEKTEEAMNKITGRDPTPDYLEPGQVIERDWLPGVRFYIFAPPKGEEDIDYEEKESDMYGLAGPDFAFLNALESMLSKEQDKELELVFTPFDRNLQWPDEKRLEHDWPGLYGRYNSPGESWRRIDYDWLYSAARLALQLDDHLNNTSLVLAVELIESDQVLLFVGDAEIGNWKSWEKVEWDVPSANGQSTKIKAADLLKRVTFYKVGHHGSHNATLREKGLELMTSSKLVAAIPVDEEFARLPKGKNKKGWDMPAGPLKERLLEKTKGRLIRADWQNLPDTTQKPDGITSAQWSKFVKSLRMDPSKLFIDYFV